MSDNNFVGKIENVKWNEETEGIFLEGYSFVNYVNTDTEEKVKKSIIISNGNKKYVIKANNVFRKDITESFGRNGISYDYSGFSCFIDLGFIDRMKPISSGKWNIQIYINVDGHEYEGDIDYLSNSVVEKLIRVHVDQSNITITVLTQNDKIFILSAIDKCANISNRKEKKRKVQNIRKYLRNRYTAATKKAVVIVYNIFCKLPVKENRITFLTDSRGGLYGNFKFVYEELRRRGITDIKCMLKPQDNTKKTLKEKIKIIYYLATSSVVLLDDYYPFIYNIIPREGVKLVQLWHASGAFKTFGFTRAGKPGWPQNPRAKNHRIYTHAIVSSKAIRRFYAEAYAISENKVIATGIPRTDVFFDNNYKYQKIQEFYEKYPILNNKKVIMFAPTFRGIGRGGYYDFENLDLDKMRENLSNEYVIIMKLHPFVSNMPNYGDKYKDFMIDLTNENEINDLLFLADILITDYSSVCFEYSLLNKPMIFFSYDMEDYILKRDFYYPYESFVPGPIVKTTEEIIDTIKSGDFKLDKLEKFRSEFFDHFDGKSSKRVVDMLLENN
jgi:CDP-ribitol ribitolphosphotransferase